jgi:hypothetical protein
MGKYSSSVVKKTKPKSSGPHAIWRGIGCLIILIVPIISAAAGYATIEHGLEKGWAIPYQLLGTPRLPEVFYISTGLWTIFGPLTRITHLYAYAFAAFLYMITIGGVTSVAYAIAFRIMGPPRWGPLDEPPPRIKTKKYTR